MRGGRGCIQNYLCKAKMIHIAEHLDVSIPLVILCPSLQINPKGFKQEIIIIKCLGHDIINQAVDQLY